VTCLLMRNVPMLSAPLIAGDELVAEATDMAHLIAAVAALLGVTVLGM